MSAEGEVWAVIWECSCAQPHVIDTDSEAGAHELAARLAEQGRVRVRVVGPVEPNIPREEVERRLAAIGLRLAVTEAMGS